MLVYNNHIPVTAGSALVPGGTGHPSELLYKNYMMSTMASFPMETWGPVWVNNSGFNYNSGGYGVNHGLKQMFLWDGYIKNSAGYDKYHTTSGLVNPGTAYQRFNYGTPIATSNNVWALQSDKLTAESGSDKVIFKITSMLYAVKSDYIYEVVHIPDEIYRDTANYSAKLSIGGFNVIDRYSSENLDSNGPVNIVRDFRVSSNYYVGNVNPDAYWSGSSNVINSDSFNIKYSYTLSSKKSLSSYNTFNTRAFAATGSLTSYFNHMSIYATAYGDVFKY